MNKNERILFFSTSKAKTYTFEPPKKSDKKQTVFSLGI